MIKLEKWLEEGWHKSQVVRTLRHILCTTEKGISVGESSLNNRKRARGEDKVYLPDGRINTGMHVLPVIVPCVMNKSSWVKWHLTMDGVTANTSFEDTMSSNEVLFNIF